MRRNRAGQHTPRVITNAVADTYSGTNERRIEFAFPNGDGGLIRFGTITHEDGRIENRIEIYNVDAGVRILAPGRVDVTTQAQT